MKTHFNKIIAFILVIILSAVAAITGFAVSAASGSDVSARLSEKNGENASRPELRDGVWQALYKTGESKLFFIDREESSFSLINPDLGIGVPSRFEYIPELGIYKLHVGCEGNVENWRVIENNDITATVSDANGDLISLFYLANDNIDTFRYYTLNELSDMARAFYEKQHGSSEGIDFVAAMKADGSFFATITGMKNDEKVVSYTVDMETAKGTDNAYETVDLSQFAE